MTLFQREPLHDKSLRTAKGLSRSDNHKGLSLLIITHEKQALPRRAFLRSAVAAGLSLGVASTLLTASDSSVSVLSPLPSNTSNAIMVLSVWSGEELATWQAICAPF